MKLKNTSKNANTQQAIVVRGMAPREYAVKRTTQTGVSISATDIGRAANFISLSAVPDVSEFTNLFDQFTIDSIDVHFVCNSAAISAGNSAIFPTLLFAQDSNDSTAPTVIGDVLSYDNMQLFQFSESDRRCRFTIRPKAQVSLAAGTGITVPGMWCSTSSASTTPWYGYKYWLVYYNSTTTNGTVLTMYLTYNMRFRSPK